MTGSRDAAAVILGRENAPDGATGTPLKRHDGRAKVTGEARYAGEEMPPNTLHAVMVTSAIAAGCVVRIDKAAAARVPGVVAVLTHEDMPRLKSGPVPPLAQTLTPMQDVEIHYEGQPVAIVLGETLESAEQGADLVAVTYQQHRVVTFESGEMRKPREQGNGYAFAPIDAGEGDIEAGFAGAAASIDQTYVTPTRHHNAMEPSTTLAEWRGDSLFMHDATQWTYGVRYALSALFAMPPEKVHVRCPYTGGGFGAKGYVWPHQVLAPLAARIVRRPVKLSIGRAGCYSGTGYQPIVRSHVRLAADREGRLAAIEHETLNVTSQFDDYVEFGSAGTRSLYATPALATRTRVVSAHVGTPTPMRAPHEGPGMFALESAIDELAYALDMDPLTLRLRNHAERDPLSGKEFSSSKLREICEEGARRFGWQERSATPRSMRDGNLLIGWGLASAVMSTFRFASKARIRLAADGAVTIEAGCQEIGAGVYTVMPQIASDVLGISADRITLRLGDTGLVETGPTAGSSTTMSTGSAVADAAEKLKARLALLNDSRQAPPPQAWNALMQDKGITELAAEGAFELPAAVAFDAHGGASGRAMYTWGVVFVEMAVDEELGRCRMRRCVAGYSAGRILNPRTARSQMIGGIILGYGRAMLEESVVDPRFGRYVSKNLSGVMLPVNADIPSDIDIFFADEYDPYSCKIGARGIGELGEVGVAAAITNGIYHATGKRIRKLPVRISDLVAGA